MDKTSARWSRRSVLSAALALGACASDRYAVPDYVFSLTCWSASDGGVDFLLMNVVDHPIEAVNALLDNLAIAVRDEAGAALTDGFVRIGGPPRTFSPAAARRLASRKALKAHIGARDLARSIGAAIGRPADPARRYGVSFETTAPVKIGKSQLADARVRSRSICNLWFEGGRARAECHGPLMGD